MFFCPKCNNLYTKIVPYKNDNQNVARLLAQVGGDSDTPSTVGSDSLEKIKKPKKKLEEGSINFSTIVDDIVAGKDVVIPKTAQIDEFVKSPAYKKLQIKQKEFVFNKLKDLLPADVMNKTENDFGNKAYFECTNCGFMEQVKEGTMIINNSYDSQNVISDNITKDILFAKELPITRQYICPNKSCKSHTDHTQRAAKYTRTAGFKLRYACESCETVW